MLGRLKGSLILCLFVIGANAATLIVEPNVSELGSVFEYEYRLTPQDGTLFSFTLEFDTTNLTGLAPNAPTGWTAFVSAGAVTWSSDDPTFDIGAGLSLDGFSLTALVGAGSVQFSGAFADDLMGQVDPTSGITLGPVSTAVPEPGSWSLLLFGCAILALKLRRSYLTPSLAPNSIHSPTS